MKTRALLVSQRVLLTAFLVALFPLAASAQALQVLAEENPPFNTVKDGLATGLGTDIFLAMTKKAGIPLERSAIKTQPWARVLESVGAQANTVAFPMARTAAREALYQWVGPLYKVQIGLIAAKSKKLKIADAAAATKYRIGTVREGAPEQALIAAGVSVDVLDRAADLASNLRKLQADRIDLLAFNATAAAYTMSTIGMNPQDYEVVFVLSEPQIYYAVSKETPAATVKALQTALDALKADGTYDKTVKAFVK